MTFATKDQDGHIQNKDPARNSVTSRAYRTGGNVYVIMTLIFPLAIWTRPLSVLMLATLYLLLPLALEVVVK